MYPASVDSDLQGPAQILKAPAEPSPCDGFGGPKDSSSLSRAWTASPDVQYLWGTKVCHQKNALLIQEE